MLKLLFYRIKQFVFRKRSCLDVNEILNPPSWIERKLQNQFIDRQYEDNLKVKEPHWSDKYDKDFKKMKKEVVRVRENG
jgi:hypothetical protein